MSNTSNNYNFCIIISGPIKIVSQLQLSILEHVIVLVQSDRFKKYFSSYTKRVVRSVLTKKNIRTSAIYLWTGLKTVYNSIMLF